MIAAQFSRIAAGRTFWTLLALVSLSAAACGADEAPAGPNPCGIVEEEPNEGPGQATPVVLGNEFQGCFGGASDVDYLKVVSPADNTGGVLRLVLLADGEATPSLILYDKAGSGDMGRHGPAAAGAPLTAFLAMAPGETFHVAIEGGGSATPSTYKLMATYTPAADAYEPNDSRATAPMVTLGSPVKALIFAGRDGVEIDPATYDDYYSFDAGGDVITVKLEDVPADVAARLFLYGPDGSELARVSSGLRGGSLSLITPIPAVPGKHVISVSLFTGTAPASTGDGATLPPHFTQPYTLTVVQP